MKSRLKLTALIAALVLLCANTAYAGTAPLAAVGPVKGEGVDNEGALDDGTQTEVSGCEDYDDENCPTPAAAEPAPTEESAPPSNDAEPEVEPKPEDEAKPEDESEPEATGDDSDSSVPKDSSDPEDAEDPEDADDSDESEDEEDFGDDE